MREDWKEYFKDNLNSWEKRTEVHVNSRFYDVETFIKEPDSLNKIETEILDNIAFSNGLHVQCHFGMDTISLAKRYQVKMTGVDFSPTALGHASRISREVKVPIDLIESNILELDQHCDETFDLVFASYGVIGWFPELCGWMEQVARRVRPGGYFLLVEFHPVMWMFDDDLKEIAYAYANLETITEDQEGTYTDGGQDIRFRNHFWNHNLEEVMTAALDQGLILGSFKEYDFTPYEIWPPMHSVEGGYRSDRYGNKLPYVYSMLWRKPLAD